MHKSHKNLGLISQCKLSTNSTSLEKEHNIEKQKERKPQKLKKKRFNLQILHSPVMKPSAKQTHASK